MLQTHANSCPCGSLTFEVHRDLTLSIYRCHGAIRPRTRSWPAISAVAGFSALPSGAKLLCPPSHTQRNHHNCGKHWGGESSESVTTRRSASWSR